MKLIEALQIANAPQDGPTFRALLACGFTPLHLETATKAHLRLALPNRTVTVETGLYGDLAGTLEGVREPFGAIFVALEWSDLDPRLAWRSMGKVDETVLPDARLRLSRLQRAIVALGQSIPVALSLPTLPLAPVFSVPRNDLHVIEAGLWEMLYHFAASPQARVLHPRTRSEVSGHDLRAELLHGFPYSFGHSDALAAGLVHLVLPPAPKKGLITDLDETLWSGVLGDDGPEGISWDLDHRSQFHGLYQHLLNQLAEAGVLIGVASKNDKELVDKALTRSDLIVNPQNLYPIYAHWSPKPASAQRILELWNIGADSIVFVDDSPMELQQVKTAFPSMECLEFRPDDPEFLLDLLDRFGKRAIRVEDRLRVTSLRGSEAVRQAATDTASLDALLSGAQAKMVLRWGKQPLDPRALELINKTNQFNLNGSRYAVADWNTYLSDRATHLAVVEYEDRFGKLGKIAVLAGRVQDGGFEIDVWVMSCRAFSRRIEYQCLKALLSRWDPVRFKFKPTERNGPVKEFLAQVADGSEMIARADFSQRCPPLYHQVEYVDD
jgi:FkbH-like protein